MKDDSAIPAANIGSTDLVALARTDPERAKQIATLEELMHEGDETEEQFLQLCRLLYEVGAGDDSELLLRRNLDFYHGENLYRELFGDAKECEFVEAIERFKTQFDTELEFVKSEAFLESTFKAPGRRHESPELATLCYPCEVSIAYLEKNVIEASVYLLDEEPIAIGVPDALLIHFQDGKWLVVDDLDAYD